MVYNSNRKPGTKLIFGGYSYGIGKEHPNRIIYYCATRRTHKCKASVVWYLNENFLRIVREHDHESNQHEINAELFTVCFSFNHLMER